MLPAFLAGAGGPIGGGEQWMSWLSLDDYLAIVHWLLQADGLAIPAPAEGPLAVNATSPEPVQNREFVHTLGSVLRRPSFAPLPAAAVRGLFGEMGVQTLLYSQRALPQRLQESGYRFTYPGLASALRLELGRLEAGSA
jgi:NAD dependent epimerase/dehydratase family enzyme